MDPQRITRLKQRLIASGIGLAVLLASLALSHTFPYLYIFPLLVAGCGAAAVKEYYHLCTLKNFHPLEGLGIATAAGYIIADFFQVQHPAPFSYSAVLLGIAIFSIFLLFFRRGKEPIANTAVTLFGILYLAVPLSMAVRINYLPAMPGKLLILYLLAVTIVADSSALLFGKLFGKTPLAPYISPKKTVEGVWGSVLCATIVSLLFAILTPLPFSILQALILGALLAIAAQIGDLAESLFKRDGAVKDSANLPGLGGMLDILDSLLFTSPLLYLFLQIL